MSTATITSKGQVTIPKDVRSRLGIGTGDRVEFVEIQDGVFQIVAATHPPRCFSRSFCSNGSLA